MISNLGRNPYPVRSGQWVLKRILFMVNWAFHSGLSPGEYSFRGWEEEGLFLFGKKQIFCPDCKGNTSHEEGIHYFQLQSSHIPNTNVIPHPKTFTSTSEQMSTSMFLGCNYSPQSTFFFLKKNKFCLLGKKENEAEQIRSLVDLRWIFRNSLSPINPSLFVPYPLCGISSL